MLPDLTVLSAVSGGALLEGLLGTRWRSLSFRNGVAENFAEEVAQPTLDFCGRDIDVKASLLGFFIGTRPLEDFYEKQIVGRATLQDLPDRPEFIFNAYHLETGRNWTFSKKRTHTWRIGDIEHPDTPMRKVLAASSAFPPFFPPVRLQLNPDSFRRSEYADHFHNRNLRAKVTLADGGVYDNLGVHPMEGLKDILVSNGGSPLQVEAMPRWKFWRNRATRPINTAVEQTRALRIRRLMDDLTSGRKNGALWMVSTDPKRYKEDRPSLVVPLLIEDGWHFTLGQVRARLNRFTDEEEKRLVNWGYIQADLAIRAYYRQEAEAPTRLPFSECRFHK